MILEIFGVASCRVYFVGGSLLRAHYMVTIGVELNTRTLSAVTKGRLQFVLLKKFPLVKYFNG